ncbi:MAG: 5-formyltetrahydrofolate cyclo-ligase [Caenibius sp.]
MTGNPKTALRQRLRAARKAHVNTLPASIRALVLKRPPVQIAHMVPPDAVIGFYHATAAEAPATGYAKFFQEAGHTIALPWFADRQAPMAFREWREPYANSDLTAGPFGIQQPGDDAEAVEPDVLFIPLLGFDAEGGRLGQGAGHYDRWLATRPNVLAIGLAWDCQLVDNLPLEDHDRPMTAIVTPTRLYGPF